MIQEHAEANVQERWQVLQLYITENVNFTTQTTPPPTPHTHGYYRFTSLYKLQSWIRPSFHILHSLARIGLEYVHLEVCVGLFFFLTQTPREFPCIKSYLKTIGIFRSWNDRTGCHGNPAIFTVVWFKSFLIRAMKLNGFNAELQLLYPRDVSVGTFWKHWADFFFCLFKPLDNTFHADLAILTCFWSIRPP